jgi:hypothetical protein
MGAHLGNIGTLYIVNKLILIRTMSWLASQGLTMNLGILYWNFNAIIREDITCYQGSMEKHIMEGNSNTKTLSLRKVAKTQEYKF